MQKQNVEEARSFSNEDLDLVAYLLTRDGVEFEEPPAIPRRARGVPVPLSFTQQRLWFLDQLQPGSPVYNLPTAMRVRGKLDIEALRKTFTEIVRRHEVLRTTFRTIDGNPQQIVASATEEVSFPAVDLSESSVDARESEARRLMREEVIHPFDLSTGPLMRTLLIRLTDDEHVVIVTLHHTISDGWSSTVLVREIGLLYQQFSTGRPSGLAELPLQFGDYALWQREQMQGEELQSQLEYWRRQLSDLEVIELPLDHPRPAVQTFRGAKRTDVLPRRIADELNELAQSEEATLFMVLLAAFAVLLSRYSAQTDIAVGTPVANRRRAELEPLIGFFANTLVLRLETNDCSSFRELVRRAREVCLGAYEHQDLPFEKLVEELRPERSLSHTPLFQTLFVMQNVPRGGFDVEDLRLEGLPTEMGVVKFDLTLVVEEAIEGLIYTFEYNTDLFESQTIARMSSHLALLLEDVVSNPDRQLSGLTLLSAAERRQIVYDWNDTAKPYPYDRCIHELISEQVERTPDAVAVVFEDLRLTYRQLDQRANQLAHYLAKRGVGPDVPVAILMERSIQMVVSLLGTLKAGAAYLPLDPDYPRDRLAFMVQDAAAPVLLTQQHLAERLPDAVTAHVIRVDSEADLFASESTAQPQIKPSPANVAYVIYTSGSTGQPKGVMIPHRGISNRLQWMQDAYGLNASDAVLQKTSYTFDVSVWEFFWPLMTGARLVVARPGGHQDPAYLVDLIAEQKITTIHFVPPMLKLLLEEQHLDTCTSLRRVICSGEALTNELQASFFERFSDVELHNLYGPTEASVDVSFWQCHANTTRRSVPIGRPIANTQLYILDASGKPAPIGIAGELHIGGIGLARGYLNRAALTAERFIPDPFSTDAGARLYKTGDLARFRPDANIEFLGRLDHQVKVRGFRIELPEIEAVLALHPAVQNCVVIAREDGPNEKRLVAYVVTNDNVNELELRNYVKDRLPEYMVPAVFMLLPELPLNTSGKIDRRALPAPGTTRRGSEASFVAPRTETEALLASIWADVLNLERVGVADNFFALGGDSIRSVRLLAKARERGVDFSLQQLFRHQTIAELARDIAATESRSLPLQPTKPFDLISTDDRAKLPPDVVDAYPLTMMQGGMLFHMALAPDTAVYHNVNSWHLRAQFDRERFEECVNRAVARHPILRTYFDLTSYSEPLQLVQESATLHVGVTDLRELTGDEQGAVLDQFVATERANGFDISRPPLLRFHVHLRTPDSFQFTLTESHPIFDGWSLNSTLAEIFSDYFKLLKGNSLPPVSPVSVTFRDFVLLEQQTLASEESQNFWEEKMRDANVTRLPRLPAPYRAATTQRIREEYASISPEISKQLHAVARSLKAPIKSVLLAAHQKVLSMLSGETDVVTGLLMNGRPETLDGEEVRGMFLNTVPFRLRMADGSWSDLIRTTFESEWEMLPHRRYPLLALQRQMGGRQLFEAQFNFVHFHVLENVLRTGDVEVLRDVKKRMFEEAHFLLTANFGLSVFSEQVNLMLQYDSSELSEEQVRALAGYYVETLERIARDPAESHNRQAPIPADERHRLLIEWNDTAHAYSRDKCLHELFEARVESSPHSVAVVSDDVSLTYRDLNERANQLAHFLQSRGVSTETRVAVLLERSVEMLVALLAIMKAGGAYVPLDPDYPEERLRFMLADCDARVLLTDSRLAIPESPNATVVHLDSDANEISQQITRNPASGVTPENLAYIIYTSGSTGQPKGAMLPHRGVINCVEWMQETYKLAGSDRFLFKTSLNFDASVWELFWPLMFGASIFTARHSGQQDSAYLAETIAKHEITIAYFVPSMLALFVQEPRLDHASSLRKVICGGESLASELVQRFYERLPGAELHHSYGPTETSIAAAEIVCPQEPQWTVMPIGRPLGNNQLYILDQQMEPVPTGVTGELYVGGEGLARGYHGRAGLTAEKFIPDPFSSEAGARLYRTGDLARYLPDGLVEFRGRADSQVKLRGMRVELGEIEAALREHAHVRECAAVLHGDGIDASVVAYVVTTDQTEPEELREYLRGKLPRHMLPAAFVHTRAPTADAERQTRSPRTALT